MLRHLSCVIPVTAKRFHQLNKRFYMHNHILTQCCLFIRRSIIKANRPAVVSHFSQSHLFQGGSVMSHQVLSALDRVSPGKVTFIY